MNNVFLPTDQFIELMNVLKKLPLPIPPMTENKFGFGNAFCLNGVVFREELAATTEPKETNETT